MTARERAQRYAAIFIGVGDEWANYVPVDARIRHGVVYLQGVRMLPIANGWELTDNDYMWTVTKATRPAQPAAPPDAGPPPVAPR